ncbi:MAG: amidophosphoribosyltransferase [Candidatus Brocadiia bacterium]
MCGVIGICGRPNVVNYLYQGLGALQHRGQDAAGIITYDNQFHLKKGDGLVQTVFNPKNISRLTGATGLAHVRYPTVGAGSAEDAQPIYVNTPFGIAMAHNGNVTNYFELKDDLYTKNLRHLNSGCDIEVILNVFADELTKQNLHKFTPETVFKAVHGVFRRVQGSYSVVGIIAGKGMFAFRDPHGIKPLIFGRKDESYIFASESVPLDILGYKIERDVQPGEAIFISEQNAFFKASRQFHSKRLVKAKHTPCIFEWVYFARPDSVMDGISIYEARLRLGQELSKEVRKAGLKADVVVPVPDSSKPAASCMATELDLPYREGLVKNRYIGRTFIMPLQEAREVSVRQKLNPVKSEIRGKKILLVDDSIVRGTTSREIINLVRDAGAKAIYFAVTCPPLKFPCVYGIDMQTKQEFIARNKTVKAISKEIMSDELIYQTLPGLVRAVSPNHKFCTACFSGIYPTKISDRMFKQIEEDRMCLAKC